jgi:hypothetical protein
MTFAEIEQSVRQTLDDNSGTDTLWSQADILEYARDAENEACERANLIIDSTSALTDISAVSATASYALPVTVVTVESAIMALGSQPLMETSERVLDMSHSSWRTETGTPRSYIKSPTNKLTLFPIPIVNDTINMTVSRFPNTPMVVGGSPEIDDRYHPGLILWILHRAYMKNDSETLNVEKAKDYNKKFIEFFGNKIIYND